MLGFVALASLMPASAQAALSKPERRAVDIRSIDGASTAFAARVEIHFAGNVGDALGRGALRKAQVKVELLPATGQATVITVRGPARRAREGRSGTGGAFDVIRDKRALLLLVEGLRAPVRQVVVSSGVGSAVAARDQSVVFGRLSKEIPVLDSREKLQRDRELLEQEIKRIEAELEATEREAERVIDLIHTWQQRLIRAESRGESAEARERLKDFNEYLEDLTEKRKRLRLIIRRLQRWLDLLAQAEATIIVTPILRAVDP